MNTYSSYKTRFQILSIILLILSVIILIVNNALFGTGDGGILAFLFGKTTRDRYGRKTTTTSGLLDKII